MRDKTAGIRALLTAEKYQDMARQYEKSSLKIFLFAIGAFFCVYGLALILMESNPNLPQLSAFVLICVLGVLFIVCSGLIDKKLPGKYRNDALLLGFICSTAAAASSYGVWIVYERASLLVFFTVLLSASVACLHPKWYLSFILCAVTAEVLIYALFCFFQSTEEFSLYYMIEDLLMIAFSIFLNLFHSVEKYRAFELQEQMERDRDTDALTGLLNRKSLNGIFELYGNSKEMVVLLLMDLDHFKSVNDTFGHKMGDLVLKEVGRILKGTFRRDDCIARIGGDEFFVFLPLDEKDIYVVSERISSLLSQTPITIRDKNTEVRVTFSVGAYIETAHEKMELEAMLVTADHEMYKVKTGGRNAAAILYDGSEEWIDGPPDINEKHIIEGSRI